MTRSTERATIVGPVERPVDLTPMLASRDVTVEGPEWTFERKLDGYRVLAVRRGHACDLRTRNGMAIGHQVPEIAHAIVDGIDADVVVDGELVAFDEAGHTDLGLLQRRLGSGRNRHHEPGVTLAYCIFDLLWVDGRDLRGQPLGTRRAALEAILPLPGRLVAVPHLEGDPDLLLDAACRLRWEGLVAKRVDSTYRGGRSRDWVKLTCTRHQELVVLGWTPMVGAPDQVGALVVGYHEDGRVRVAGKVGSGLADALRTELRQRLQPARPPQGDIDRQLLVGTRWVEPEVVVDVAFEEWTAAGRLRHPRLLGIRTDKDPLEVVREPDRP